ncbi:unnamed protein product [Cladocopium goreaui]|uniref:Acyl-CoA thioesterase 2 C-terminal domain-containing protein n=1 Tax=Cladocopium goreaui TaxID=2562237 RepID=A0A9P1GJV4_9DINO|nr:unnamed protein product [Cladocopium goreaui]
MPDVPDPESLPDEHERYKQLLQNPDVEPLVKQLMKLRKRENHPIDVRVILDSLNWNTEEARKKREKYALSGLGMPSQMLWFRVRERLPDDEHVHHSVLAYQSDAELLSTARVELPWRSFWSARPMMASLDHAMWFHHPFPRWRADDWLLYVMYSPRLTGARGLSHGHIFTRDGWLVVSCSQEGLIRPWGPSGMVEVALPKQLCLYPGCLARRIPWILGPVPKRSWISSAPRISMSGVTWQMKGGESNDLIDKGADERIFKVSPLGPWAPRYQEDIKGAQEEMLNSLFSPTPEPSEPGDAGQDAADACDAWDLGQEPGREMTGV